MNSIDFRSECPKCGSDDLDYDCMDIADETMVQDVWCNDCNASFQIYSVSKWKIDLDSIDYGEDDSNCIDEDL